MYNLVFANEKGEYFLSDLQAVGRTGNRYVEIEAEDLIPLPQGAGLVLIPGGHPIGMNPSGDFTLLKEDPDQSGEAAYALSATLPQGYSRTLLPAYQRHGLDPLPLFGYTAVVSKGERLYVAAVQTDHLKKWDPAVYSTPELAQLIDQRLRRHPQNRLLQHLSHCALEYQCFTAQNIFYGRWEGGLPSSPTCNAHCLGCISQQPAECCPSPQSRLTFRPTVQELVEVAADHLEKAPEGIISMGQGCEGEPSLAADILAPAIEQVRRITAAGTINMNSNAGYTPGVKKIVDAGLNSLRVSMISARPQTYQAYYRSNYSLSDVAQSIIYGRQKGVYVSINLLTLPGLNDQPEEIEALMNFIEDTGAHMVQIRNLNMDPDHLLAQMPPLTEEPVGITAMIQALQTEFPQLEIGNYSRPQAEKEKNKTNK